MGFFSQECHGCHMSILAPYNLWVRGKGGRPVNLWWMNDVVAITKDGVLCSGSYDGYSRIDPDTNDERGEQYWDDVEAEKIQDRVIGITWDDRGEENHAGPTVWHRACWIAAGQPRDWKGQSPNADDQGYFFDPEDYATAKAPRNAAVLAKLAGKGLKLKERRRRDLERELAKYERSGK
jgi:hypothetical protein